MKEEASDISGPNERKKEKPNTGDIAFKDRVFYHQPFIEPIYHLSGFVAVVFQRHSNGFWTQLAPTC